MSAVSKCGLCGTLHDSMQAAMDCCSDQFDDDPDAPEVAA